MQQLEVAGIHPIGGSSYIAFLLSDRALFFGTGFKVLKSQDADYFLPSVRSSFNGMTKLTYFTEGYVPLADYSGGTDIRAFRFAMKRLVEAAIEIQANGFLSIRNILFDLDRVYVRLEDGEIGLVYLPVSISVSGKSDLQACRAIYELCADAFASVPGMTSTFDDELESQGYEAGNLSHLLKQAQRDDILAPGPPRQRKKREPRTVFPSVPSATPTRGITVAYNLLPVGKNSTLPFLVDKPRVVIGRSPDQADFVIKTSPAVGRRHCVALLSADGKLRVADMGSRNGTYVNGRRLAKGQEVGVVEGDHLRLADVEFVIRKAG